MTTPLAQRLALQCNDGEEAQAFLSSIYVPLRVAARTHAPVDFGTMAVHCGGVAFSTSTSRSGLRFLFDEPFDGYGMTIPLTGSMTVDTGTGRPTASRASGGLMMDSRTVFQATFSPLSAWQRITVSTDELHQRLVALTERPVLHRLKFDPHFRLDRGAPGVILGISQAVIQGMRGDAPLLSSPTALLNLKEAVLATFVETMPHSHSAHLGRRVPLPAPRHVRRAIEFMHANLLLPLRLEDIALAAQTSPRSLQLAFRRFRDATPMEYLRQLRLEGARGELTRGAPGATVADVAYRWGFPHHGMFASRYARRFGETPSATLRTHRDARADRDARDARNAQDA